MSLTDWLRRVWSSDDCGEYHGDFAGVPERLRVLDDGRVQWFWGNGWVSVRLLTAHQRERLKVCVWTPELPEVIRRALE